MKIAPISNTYLSSNSERRRATISIRSLTDEKTEFTITEFPDEVKHTTNCMQEAWDLFDRINITV